jgi:hypothetical protein
MQLLPARPQAVAAHARALLLPPRMPARPHLRLLMEHLQHKKHLL